MRFNGLWERLHTSVHQCDDSSIPLTLMHLFAPRHAWNLKIGRIISYFLSGITGIRTSHHSSTIPPPPLFFHPCLLSQRSLQRATYFLHELWLRYHKVHCVSIVAQNVPHLPHSGWSRIVITTWQINLVKHGRINNFNKRRGIFGLKTTRNGKLFIQHNWKTSPKK